MLVVVVVLEGYYNGFVVRHKHLLLRAQIPIPVTITTTKTIYRIHPSGKLSCCSTSYIKAQPKIKFKYSLVLLLLLLFLLLLLLLLLAYIKLGSQGTSFFLSRLFWLCKWLLCSKLKTIYSMTFQELSWVVRTAHSLHCMHLIRSRWNTSRDVGAVSQYGDVGAVSQYGDAGAVSQYGDVGAVSQYGDVGAVSQYGALKRTTS